MNLVGSDLTRRSKLEREGRTSLPNNQGRLNFVDGAEAERIEERRAEDTPAPGRAAEDSLVAADIPAVGIPAVGIPAAGILAVDSLPFRTPPADNLSKKRN